MVCIRKCVFTVAEKGVFTITLRLPDVDALFETSEVSPFSEAYEEHSYTSGIEYIVGELYANTSYKKVHALFSLPPEQVEPGLETEVQKAVKRYCRGQLADVRHEMQAMRWRGLRSLAIAIVVLVLFVAVAFAIGETGSLVLQIMSESLIIIGWVVLWVPLETLFYEVWHYRLDRKIYSLLMDMDVTITPSP